MEPKKSYLSKTLRANALVLLASFVPSLSVYLGDSASVVQGLSVLNIVLRLVTKGKVELW